MGTRIYLADLTAPVTPTSWSAGWDSTGSTGTSNAYPYNIVAADTGRSAAGTGVSGQHRAIQRFVSPPLAAQTINGTLKGQLQCLQTNATDNYNLAIAVKVVQADGSDRGVLLAVSASDDVSATPPEMATTRTNRKVRDSAESTSLSLSSVDVSAGDCLVIEVGFRQDSTSTANGSVRYSAASSTDLPENDTDTTTTKAPWVEFSDTITFQTPLYYGSASTPADGASATNTADPTAVTPPTGMLAGDLVCMIGHQRAAGATLAITEAGGQSWTSEAAIGGTLKTARLFWCVFDGTWDADPSVDFGAAVCNSVHMHVFRPPATDYTWSVNQALVELDIAAAPHTITGQTTTGTDPTVTLAGWFTSDDNTWGTLTGTGWEVTGTAQYRNTSGSDQSATYAHKIQAAAAATGDVTKTQLTLGDDASATFIITFAAAAPLAPITWIEASSTSALMPVKHNTREVVGY